MLKLEASYGLDDEWEYIRSADGLIQNPMQFMGVEKEY